MLPFLTALAVAMAAPDTLPLPPAPAADTVPAGDAPAAPVTASGAPLARPDALVLLAPVEPRFAPLPRHVPPFGDTTAQASRQPPIEHGDAYYTRLAIHRWTSYATLPLLVAQYVVGRNLEDGDDGDDAGDAEHGEDALRAAEDGDDDGGSRGTHQALATGIAAVYGINSITGTWNLIESWREPGNARKAHSILMLLADAAFVATFATAPEDDDGAGSHRTLAIAGAGLSLAGYAIMLPTLFGRD